ncbi:MAG TPA: hypothetical protein VG820_11300 [Fimbriimonadaceae bacterium]|jgi:hypothetical protein|nr:hypothetical protein [Fimbriimonadaceae bacterium]
MPISAKRKMLRRSIQSVTLEKSDPTPPLAADSRVHLTFVDQA